MAEGTFNAGLLSTEAGTLGRFTGNLLLSVAGHVTGLDSPQEVRILQTCVRVTLCA